MTEDEGLRGQVAQNTREINAIRNAVFGIPGSGVKGMAGKLDEIIDRDDERKIMLKEAERRLTVRLAIVTALLTAITLLLGYFVYRAQMENHVSFFRSAPRASLSASEELPFKMR